MCTLLCIKNEEINGREGQREIEDEGKAVERETLGKIYTMACNLCEV